MVKKMLEALGVKPEELLTKDAQAFPHRAHVRPTDRDQHQLQVLTKAIREAVKGDLLDTSIQSWTSNGSPGETTNHGHEYIL